MKCLVVHEFRNDEPVAVAVHFMGFQAVIAFKDKIVLYNVLMDKLRPYRDTVLKNTREVKYSNGGHYFAAGTYVRTCARRCLRTCVRRCICTCVRRCCA